MLDCEARTSGHALLGVFYVAQLCCPKKRNILFDFEIIKNSFPLTFLPTLELHIFQFCRNVGSKV